MFKGDTLRVDLSAHFRDPDGDGLTFTAEASDESVTSVSVSGSVLTVVAAGWGRASVGVTATDPGGLSASQSFGVTVRNRAPIIADSIPAAEMFRGDTLRVDLSAHFRDPDGDGLTFTAEASDESVTSVSVSGSVLTVVAAGRGTASVGVTATDPGGLSASQSFGVTVRNRAPIIADSIPAAEMFRGDTLRVDLSAHFRDPDGDGLTFTAETSDAAVASVTVSGDTLAVAAVAAGEATITATAADPEGLEVSQDFVVEITVKVASIAVTPDSIELTALEEMVQLSARAFDASGKTVRGAEFSWSSEDAAVATVDAAGIVTATGRGGTTIVVTAEGVSGTAIVSVAPVAHAITITPPEATIPRGDTVRLSAAATDRNGYAVAGADLVWTSGDPAVATVAPSDPPVTALVRGVGEGSAAITVFSGRRGGERADHRVGRRGSGRPVEALRDDGRTELDGAHQLADGRAAPHVVRRAGR